MATEDDEIYKIRDHPDNKICADCDSKTPEWASINLGIFICIKCAGIHRNLGVQISKVRSLTLDHCWDTDVNTLMKKNGNVKVRDVFECHAPIYYIRPSSKELSPFVRNNWIDQKYTKSTFKEGSDINNLFLMPEATKSGILWKQNKKSVWQQRKFILHTKYLFYYKDETDSYPKGHLDVSQLKISIPEDTTGRGKKFLFELETKERTYPIACETMEEMFDWVHALKRALIYYSKIFQGEDLSPTYEGSEEKKEQLPLYASISKLIKKEGELNKQGGRHKTWKQRWCVLTETSIFYFKNANNSKPKSDAFPEGEITLVDCDIDECEGYKKKHLFSLVCRGRVYFLTATDDTEYNEWITTITELLSKRDEKLKEKVDFEDRTLEIN